MKYAFIKENALIYPIKVMCRVLGVSKSGYFQWLRRKPSKRSLENKKLQIEVLKAHADTRKTYGYKRLHSELVDRNVNISQYKVRRIRREMDVFCIQPKRFKVTTQSDHDKMTYDNLLNQNFNVSAPNQAFVSDITYIWTTEGWLYLAGVKDLYSCELVGYAMSSRMTTDLCLKALNMAITRRKPGKGLILHSDRGSQYCSKVYQKAISTNGFRCSMSGKGNCYDNAPIESFWSTLKNELVHQKHYVTRHQAIEEITEYIEVFYNRIRKHSKLGNISPAQALQRYWQNAV